MVAVAYVVVKMTALAVVTYAVVDNLSLSPLARSLVVALASGLLGVFGIIVGAVLNGRTNKEILEQAARNHELAEDNRQLLEELHAVAAATGQKVSNVEGIVERRQAPRE